MTATPSTVERWIPSAAQIANANVTAFMRELGVADYHALLAYAKDDLAAFYARLLQRLDLQWDAPWSTVLDLSRGKPFARWFVDARYNAAANCLERWIARGFGDAEALVWEGEDGAERRYSFSELREEVARLGKVLRELGVRPG
jgi:acetyl-CoA synthetase